MQGLIDCWVCVKVANGILWWMLTPRLTCTVLRAGFNPWFMLTECSGLRHKCFQFLIATSLFFVSIALFLVFFCLTFTFPFLALPPWITVYQCYCRGRWLIGECFVNDGPIQDSKWLENIPDIWSMCCRTDVQNTVIASVVYSLNCATHDRNSIM